MNHKDVPQSVVYAGDAGTERTASFERFLKERFGSVTVVANTDLPDFPKDADVLIIDGEIRMENHRLNMGGPGKLKLSDFPIPTVLIGGVGGAVGDQLKLKLSWGHG